MNKKVTMTKPKAKTLKVTFLAMDNGMYEMKGGCVKSGQLYFNKDNESVNGEKMKKPDYFLIEFALDDQTTAKNLCVPANPLDAAWICTPRQSNPPICPKTPCYDSDIFVSAVDAENNTITIYNPDMIKESFQFTLRFLPVGADPKVPGNYLPYDPIGQNDNGGVSLK
jgi:hypothetical protein